MDYKIHPVSASIIGLAASWIVLALWSSGGGYSVSGPDWLIVLGCVAAPWIKWSSRFSLRTLLIATTLVAVGLGIVAMFS
jgi:hypothetical protein